MSTTTSPPLTASSHQLPSHNNPFTSPTSPSPLIEPHTDNINLFPHELYPPHHPIVSPTPLPSTNTHPMQTKAKNNLHKPIKKLNLKAQLLTSDDLEPTTMTQALKNPKWHQAMSKEFDVFSLNGTWELVPSTPSQNIVECKWIFRLDFLLALLTGTRHV